MKFTEWLKNNWKHDNMLPPALSGQEALDFLMKYLLGEDYYTMSLTVGQGNVEVVNDILTKYSKKYRKENKKIMKNLHKEIEEHKDEIERVLHNAR